MTSRTARLLLVRHGETEWHAENRYAGISDIALTPEGREQGAALARWAAEAGVSAVVASPLGRARHTAEPAANALGLPLEVVPGLREMDFGWGEGRTIAEMAAEDPEAVRRFREDADSGLFPGAEPLAAVAARATAALRELAVRHPGGTVLVVAHSTLLRIALCALLGLPLGRYRLIFPRLDNTAVTEVRFTADETGRAALYSLNIPTATAVGAATGADGGGPRARTAAPESADRTRD